MSKHTPPQSPVKRFWLKWRFHLNILLVLIPLGLMPKYLHEASMDRGEIGLGERELGELNAGPWSVRLAERFDEAPRSDGPAGYFKQFKIALCEQCSDIKAVYLRVGKPRSLRAAGALFVGTTYRMTGEVNIPQRPGPTPSCGSPSKAGTGRCTRPRFPWPRHRRPPWRGFRNKEASNETLDGRPRPAPAAGRRAACAGP